MIISWGNLGDYNTQVVLMLGMLIDWSAGELFPPPVSSGPRTLALTGVGL